MEGLKAETSPGFEDPPPPPPPHEVKITNIRIFINDLISFFTTLKNNYDT